MQNYGTVPSRNRSANAGRGLINKAMAAKKPNPTRKKGKKS